MNSLDNRFPSIADLRARAAWRIPHFAWEYLDSGTGLDMASERNMSALQGVQMWPGVLHGDVQPRLETEIFGRVFSAPFGMAPVGLTGLMWPGGEKALARAAAAANIPMGLSTVANANPETVGRHVNGNGWFQLYPTKDEDVREDIMARAWGNGFRTLLVTVDVPVGSRRERQRKAGIRVPPAKDLLTVWRAAKCPAWSAALLREGMPRFWTLEPYAGSSAAQTVAEFAGSQFDGVPSWELLARIRDAWKGAVVVKGVMRPQEAERAIALGVDGIGVSNHGGRQFDATPAAITALPAIKAVVGDRAKIVFDSGLRSGLDIARALALGADFCLLGRAFIYGLGALGAPGAAHVIHILRQDLITNMIQMGAESIADLPSALVSPHPV
ncbi:alpha-hydroxy-acid oxidizing protein [Paroceanicella profunda]|uniref:Alpha-hydroxy-acid oxidizing protein n=1 Tax=Paroceanicella profunda TaxID=2579971 RepID=A0A5B8FG46_9RHOB|nr:alpha-hydroxy acid oxidase [Paroceanicella profunda]QDL90771.1 alpha-hydroxy-acid oxidizing protein [Paroceanicella profunda]